MSRPGGKEAGLHNWLVLVALSVIFILILTASEKKGRVKSPGERHYSFLEQCRQVEVLIMNEVFISIRQPPPKPPPRKKDPIKKSRSNKTNEQEIIQFISLPTFQEGTIHVNEI